MEIIVLGLLQLLFILWFSFSVVRKLKRIDRNLARLAGPEPEPERPSRRPAPAAGEINPFSGEVV